MGASRLRVNVTLYYATRPNTPKHLMWCVVVCDLETSRMGAPYVYIYIYDVSSLRVNTSPTVVGASRLRVNVTLYYSTRPNNPKHINFVL